MFVNIGVGCFQEEYDFASNLMKDLRMEKEYGCMLRKLLGISRNFGKYMQTNKPSVLDLAIAHGAF